MELRKCTIFQAICLWGDSLKFRPKTQALYMVCNSNLASVPVAWPWIWSMAYDLFLLDFKGMFFVGFNGIQLASLVNISSMTVVYNVNKFNKYGPVWSITSITSTIEYGHKIAKLVNIALKTLVYRNQITPVNGTPAGPTFQGFN